MEIARLIGGIPAVTAVLVDSHRHHRRGRRAPSFSTSPGRTPEGARVRARRRESRHWHRTAFEEGEVAGSFAGLGMALNALLTALLVPHHECPGLR